MSDRQTDREVIDRQTDRQRGDRLAGRQGGRERDPKSKQMTLNRGLIVLVSAVLNSRLRRSKT